MRARAFIMPTKSSSIGKRRMHKIDLKASPIIFTLYNTMEGFYYHSDQIINDQEAEGMGMRYPPPLASRTINECFYHGREKKTRLELLFYCLSFFHSVILRRFCRSIRQPWMTREKRIHPEGMERNPPAPPPTTHFEASKRLSFDPARVVVGLFMLMPFPC